MPHDEPELVAANRRRRRARRALIAVCSLLFLAFAAAQLGWMVMALFGT